MWIEKLSLCLLRGTEEAMKDSYPVANVESKFEFEIQRIWNKSVN